MNKIASINYTENGSFNVNLTVNKKSNVIGYGLNSFQEAYSIANEYQLLDDDIQIVIAPNVKENMDIYTEFRMVSRRLGLPDNSFEGIADKLIVYKEEKKGEKQSYQLFVEWLTNRTEQIQ